PLQDHRHHLGHEDQADKGQHEFGLEQDGHDAERAPESERAGVTHEDLRRMRVVPEKSDQRADQRKAENGELTRIWQEEQPDIPAPVIAADRIRKYAERAEGDRREPGAEAIET